MPTEPLDPDRERRLIRRFNRRSTDSTQSAIERGQILKALNLHWKEYESKKLRCTRETGDRLIKLVDNPRMKRDDWTKPKDWSATYELLLMTEKCFQAMLDEGSVNYHTTKKQVLKYRKTFTQRPSSEPAPAKPLAEFPYLNQIVRGNCLDLIAHLPDDSIDSVVTSPPYAEQRSEFYPTWSVQKYPEEFGKVMKALHPKLKDDGNVIIVISEIMRHEEESHYVAETIRELIVNGWRKHRTFYWHKPDAGSFGSTYGPRTATEMILWFTKRLRANIHPYADFKACGKWSDRIGLQGPNPQGTIHGTSRRMKSGRARIDNLFDVPIRSNDKNSGHPAVFPRELIHRILLTWVRAKSDAVVLDPFCGSGTVPFQSREMGHNFIGFEIVEEYVDIATNRMKRLLLPNIGIGVKRLQADDRTPD